MKLSTVAICALSLGIAAGCGKKQEEKTDKPKTDKPKTDKPKTDKKPDKPTTTKKPTDKPPTTKPVDKPTAPAPGEVAFGDFKLVRCTTDGPVMKHRRFSQSIKAVVATEKVVYVVDNDEAIRKYNVGAGPACTLKLDRSFGDKGILKPEKKPRVIATDHKGTLYVVSNSKLWRYSDGKLVNFCKERMFATETVTFAADDSFALVSGFGDKWFRLDISADSCKKTPWMSEPKLHHKDADIIGDKVYVVGKKNIKDKYRLFAYGLKGGKPTKTFETGDKTGDPTVLCHSSGAASCGKGVCIADANCRKWMVFGPDGKSKQIKFKKEHFNHSYVWVEEMDQATPDIAYMAVSIKQPKDPKDPKAKAMHHGFVYRVSGLAAK